MNTFSVRDGSIPLEVRLAWEVMTCRGMRTTYERKDHPCHWFNDNYGPYPAYDWIEDFPRENFSGNERILNAVCKGNRYQLPELMSGCRKAPIMTIGINPNLTAYWTGVDGATWCYPYFDDIGQYAYYFRHRAIYQERFLLDFIKSSVIPGTKVEATNDGWIKMMSRSDFPSAIWLFLEYQTERIKQEGRLLESDYKIFFNSKKSNVTEKNVLFKKGDMIAGRIDLKEKVPTEICQEEVGYYKRFQSIFELFKKLVGTELEGSDLRMAEDVCQGDMVACASPGWESRIPDSVRKGIKMECVRCRQWLIRQMLQTRPKVIVFSGRSALAMFDEVMGSYFEPKLDLSKDSKQDVYDLLKLCEGEGIYLKVNQEDLSFQSRIIVSPHFSYDENFKPHCRFTQEEWNGFSQSYPQAAEKLSKVTSDASVTSDAYKRKLIGIKDKNAPSKEELGEEVCKVLADHFYDPPRMIAQILNQEYQAGRLVMDKKTGHLGRTDGPCRFCDNQLFAFPEGCLYGKIVSREPQPNIDLVARSLLESECD